MATMSVQVETRMQELAQAVAADEQAGGRNRPGSATPNSDVDRFDDIGARHERCRDDEQHGDDIEREQRVAEADAPKRRSFVKLAQRALQVGDSHERIFTLRGMFSSGPSPLPRDRRRCYRRLRTSTLISRSIRLTHVCVDWCEPPASHGPSRVRASRMWRASGTAIAAACCCSRRRTARPARPRRHLWVPMICGHSSRRWPA